MQSKHEKVEALIHYFFLACFIVLGGAFLFLLNQVRLIRNQKSGIENKTAVSQISTPTPIPESTEKVITKTEAITSTPKTAKTTSYLNLNGNFTTTNTDWTDVVSTDTVINLQNDYGKGAYVDWDAAIKISSSGSKVLVRLYDVTHKIGVAGSDLSTNSIISTRVASGSLNFWSGTNTYRVQIKSLNGSEAAFDGGRIKIVY